MTVIDPVNGGKIYSVVGLKRRLGLLPPVASAPEPSASSAPKEEGGAANGVGEAPREGRWIETTRRDGQSSRRDMTEQQIEEVIAAIEAMRKRSHNTNEVVHGWKLTYILRAGSLQASATDKLLAAVNGGPPTECGPEQLLWERSADEPTPPEQLPVRRA